MFLQMYNNYKIRIMKRSAAYVKIIGMQVIKVTYVLNYFNISIEQKTW